MENIGLWIEFGMQRANKKGVFVSGDKVYVHRKGFETIRHTVVTGNVETPIILNSEDMLQVDKLVMYVTQGKTAAALKRIEYTAPWPMPEFRLVFPVTKLITLNAELYKLGFVKVSETLI